MRRTITVSLLLGLCLSIVLPASLAATGTIEVTDEESPVLTLDQSANRRLVDLFGTTIYADGAPRIGTVADAIVDIGQGAVIYFVIRFSDDRFGDPDALYPLPLYFFVERDEGGLTFLLEDETFISNMPTLDEIVQAPDVVDGSEWDRWVYSYWNAAPALPTTELRVRRDQIAGYRYRYGAGPRVTPTAMLRATELIGTTVRDPEADAIGTITDAVYSILSAQLLLFDLEPTAAVGASEDHYLIPTAAFMGNRATETITYDLDEYGLRGPSGYTERYPAIRDADYHERLANYWNTRGVETRYGLGMPIVPVRLLAASTLIGYDLFTPEATSPGSVVDMIVGADGTIEYAVIELSGVLEVGGNRALVPLSILTLRPGGETMAIHVRNTDFDTIPTFPPNRIPDTAASDWDSAVRAYWNNLYRIENGGDVGTIPTVVSVSRLSAGAAVPATALLEMRLVDRDGGEIGDVETIQVDLVEGRVGFVVVQVDEPGIGGGPVVPVPVGALDWRPSQRQVILDADADADRLRNAPGYDDVPELPHVTFLDALEAYWLDRE